MEHVGQTVTLAGFLENVREVGQNFAFAVLRDFYGVTPGGRGERGHVEGLQGAEQGVHRPDHRCGAGAGLQEPQAAHRRHRGGAEAVEVLGRCRHNELPFQINRSREADESARLKYRYLGSPQPGGEEQHHPPLPGGGRPAEGHA